MRLIYLFLLCLLPVLGFAQDAPTIAAPAPTVDAARVVSVYSNAYDNIPLDAIFTPWSNAQFLDTIIDGSNMLRYTQLGFTGIEMVGPNALDLMALGMDTVHFDYWSPNAEALLFKLVDFGGTGFEPQNDNTEVEIRVEATTGQWVSVDLPLSDFAAMNMTDINQIVLAADPFGATTAFVDNIYFYGDGVSAQQLSLPVTFEEDNVNFGFSDFGGTSTSVITDPTDPDNRVASTTKFNTAELWAGTSLGTLPAGIAFAPDRNVITVRVWSPTAGTPVRLKVEDQADPGISVETEDTTTVAMGWEMLTFDLARPVAGSAGVIDYDNTYDLLSLFFNFGTTGMEAGEQTYYWDDVSFPAGTGTGGSDEGLSLPVSFEDEDEDYGLIDFGGAVSMRVTDPTDAGNTVAQTTKPVGAELWAGTSLRDLEEGIAFVADSNVITVRVWSPTAGTPVRLKVEDQADGGIFVETEDTTTVAMEWETLAFDLSRPVAGSAGVLNYDNTYDRVSIFFNFGTTGADAGEQTYYWDDVEFTEGGGDGGGMMNVPMTAAPDPIRNADSVLSLFSGVYDDVTVDTWRTDWSNAAFMDVEVDGNPTKRYDNLGFVGIETIANPVDLTPYTHLHVDYWTADIDTLLIKLVDFGGTGFDPMDDNTEFELAFETTQGEWVGLDVPLADFVGMNLNDINQYILSGRPFGTGTVFVDNFYFYTERPSSLGHPERGLLQGFPNPALDRFTVTAPVRMDRLEVIDANGRRVADYLPGTERFEVPTAELPTGLYVVLVAAGERQFVTKFLRR